MRTALILAAIAATLATGATARTTTVHHRHTMTHADSGSAAVRELNAKSLQQASAGGMATPPAAMSDSGAAMTPPAAMPTDAAPMAGPAMSPTDQTAPPAPTPQ